MEITLISDNNITVDTDHFHNFTFTTSITRRRNFTLSSHTHHHRHEIRSQLLPIDAIAPPPVKPTTIPKSRTGKRSRVRRKRKTDGFGAGESGDIGGGFFGGGGGNGDGPFGGGGNFGWEESPSPGDPAFDFIYEALTWFVLSNCMYFAFKRVVRIVIDGSGDRRLR
uniref:growth/differentiation factor 7-like n=1 Tax=Erigeron canadensis TaxID=72917 RepID=UPI001CB95C76|nr:growth/differentiation factor 7-like [Erigeron canadensis]